MSGKTEEDTERRARRSLGTTVSKRKKTEGEMKMRVFREAWRQLSKKETRV
jgi:hypothetical protein